MSAPRAGGAPRALVGRRRLLLGAFALAGVVVLGRAFQLQALERDRWVQTALEQHREREPLAARRGSIYDRDGVPLALSHETFRVSVAPGEIRDRKAARKALREALGLSERAARRATDPERRWVVLPGRFTAEQRRRLGDPRGVYVERRLERFYPQGEVAREVIGVVSADGRALGGVEQQFDGVLRGEAGYAVMRRDARGGAQPAVSLPVVPPRDGGDVYLTIDLDLQEIADGALREAIRSTGSSGGDLLLMDPHTGELLAAVSRRGGRGRSLSAITEPYEPGSTLKLFTAAAVLAEGEARMQDSVFAENGRWQVGRRVITDSHAEGWLSLHDVIRVSSNVGIAKLAARLTPAEQYEYLRDFGFGTPTGIEYPAESAGRLRRPGQWSALSQQSLAMGYELSATPLQVAAAYGALANGGTLMEPHLLRELRGAEGARRREPVQVRRVIPPEVAGQLTDALVEVVTDGTGTSAALANFEVAGKTGTSRRTGAGGRYQAGSYTATFAGYFPARDPQLVIYVKLDQPQGSYYGGLTAAPVTRETLHGILAAHSPSLDRRSLLAARLPGPVQEASAPAAPAGRGSAPPVATREGTYVFEMGATPTAAAPAPAAGPRAVPALEGLLLRDAARRAHALGLRVRVQGGGRVARTEPAAGAELQPGDTLLLVGGTR